MYHTSQDRRFEKNKALIRRAYLDLAVEKGTEKVTVSDITRRADINRMTFYSHYDTVQDVFSEFVDDMERELRRQMGEEPVFDPDRFFEQMKALMLREIDFFRAAAREPACAELRDRFRTTIRDLLSFAYSDRSFPSGTERAIRADLDSALISYAYFDWLHGNFGSADIDDVIGIVKKMIGG